MNPRISPGQCAERQFPTWRPYKGDDPGCEVRQHAIAPGAEIPVKALAILSKFKFSMLCNRCQTFERMRRRRSLATIRCSHNSRTLYLAAIDATSPVCSRL
jgi:hypothetical protein